MNTVIKISEIFGSISEEIYFRRYGSFATFVRFAGCPLNCSYCDTEYAKDITNGSEWTVKDIRSIVKGIGCTHVIIVGGEPLLQFQGLSELIRVLNEDGRIVTVRTSGACDTGTCEVWPDCWVVNYRLPGSGEYDKMVSSSFENLRKCDFVRFSIMDEKDFKTALEVQYWLEEIGKDCTFIYSPVSNVLEPKQLFDWLVEAENLNVVLSLAKAYSFRYSKKGMWDLFTSRQIK